MNNVNFLQNNCYHKIYSNKHDIKVLNLMDIVAEYTNRKISPLGIKMYLHFFFIFFNDKPRKTWPTCQQNILLYTDGEKSRYFTLYNLIFFFLFHSLIMKYEIKRVECIWPANKTRCYSVTISLGRSFSV